MDNARIKNLTTSIDSILNELIETKQNIEEAEKDYEKHLKELDLQNKNELNEVKKSFLTNYEKERVKKIEILTEANNQCMSAIEENNVILLNQVEKDLKLQYELEITAQLKKLESEFMIKRNIFVSQRMRDDEEKFGKILANEIIEKKQKIMTLETQL
jgi:hypothetical protein